MCHLYQIVNTVVQCVICKTEHWCINLSFFILFDFSSFTPISPLSRFLFPLSLSLWPSQNSNEIKWSLICMHLQNIACAVFAIKGMEKRVAVVLVGVYVLPHWHQTVFWYGNGGQGKNGCSLRLCLDIGQGLYSRLSFSPSRLFSFYSFSHGPVHVLDWHGDLSSLLLRYSTPGVTVDLFYQQCPWHFEPTLTVQVFFPVYSQTFQEKVYIFKSWMTVLSFHVFFFQAVCAR